MSVSLPALTELVETRVAKARMFSGWECGPAGSHSLDSITEGSRRERRIGPHQSMSDSVTE